MSAPLFHMSFRNVQIVSFRCFSTTLRNFFYTPFPVFVKTSTKTFVDVPSRGDGVDRRGVSAVRFPASGAVPGRPSKGADKTQRGECIHSRVIFK